jgi:hypothetical protein
MPRAWVSVARFEPRRGRPFPLRRLALYCLPLLAGLGIAPAQAANNSFVTVENRSAQIVKIAVPGGRPARVQPGSDRLHIDIEVTQANGVDAKAWWVANPRQLCVIFVRYEGHVVIAGKENIRCLGH